MGRADCELARGQYKVRATGGTATIGYGETSADFIDRYWGKRITQLEALVKMAERVPGFYQGVRTCISTELTEHQWEAITCRAYQTGARGFCESDTAELIRSGDLDAALAMWREEFAHADRSEAEIAHFLTPDTQERPMPEIVSRAEWGARSPRSRSTAPNMTRGVAVHWLGETGAPRTHADCPGTMRWVQNLHMDDRGWSDFAYNMGVCPHGVIFEGRGPRVRNAANGGGTRDGADANGAWAAVLYFDALNDGPGLTPEGKAGINAAAEYLGVAAGEWLGHRDFLSTGCPGDEIYAWVHSGHPGGKAPLPGSSPEEEDLTMFIFDAPPERGGGVWQSDGVFRKPVRTGDTWPNVEGDPKAGRPAVAKHIGVATVGLFDDLIDIEAALAAKIVVPTGESGAIDYDALAKAVADELSGRLTG